jgi:hypothetical protein
LSVAHAVDGTWYKGCQTLPTSSNTQETRVWSSNCNGVASPGQHLSSRIVKFPLVTINPLIAGGNVCHTIEETTLLTCANLNFCTLPLESIDPSIKPDNAWTEPRQTAPSKISTRFLSTSHVFFSANQVVPPQTLLTSIMA